MKARTTSTLAIGAVALLALAGCSADEPTSSSTPVDTGQPTVTEETPSSTPVPTPSTAGALTEDEISTVMSSIDFEPDAFASTEEMFASVYPGVSASDAGCLLPFGVGWAEDAQLSSATTQWGPSTDRSMTAVVASAADENAAEDIADRIEDSVENCLESGATFELQGVAVDLDVDDFDLDINGADDDEGWKATGTLAGTNFTLIGSVARVGTNVVTIVGWDPQSNESFVPQATQMFVDAL